MDKKLLIQLISGTILRGLIWGVSIVSAWSAVESPDEETLTKVAKWLAAFIVAAIGIAWSMTKNKKLLKTPSS